MWYVTFCEWMLSNVMTADLSLGFRRENRWVWQTYLKTADVHAQMKYSI